MAKKSRCLQSYERIAHKDHGLCSLCELPIFAGDPYFANVWVGPKGLWVEKFHNGCPIDLDQDQKERQKQSRKTVQQLKLKAA